MSVTIIAEKWHDVKDDIAQNQSSLSGLTDQIDNFQTALNDFFASPVFYMYTIYHADEMKIIRSLDTIVSGLKTELNSGDSFMIYRSVLEIDSAVKLLQRVDADLSAKSQLHYFQLFFFFSMLIIIIVLSMRFLNSSLEKAENRKKQTLAFSRETVMAQENERKRIARELHNSVLQDMWRLSFRINNEETTAEHRAIMQRIRVICDTLIPPDFQRRGLINALESLCYSFRQRNIPSIECHITIQENLSLALLNNDTQLQCYRIIQECLTNIEKHSQANDAAVQIYKQTDDSLLIYVSDNGKGFSPPDMDSVHSLRAEGHFGLWDIYERAVYINAVLKIDSKPGEGTVITLHIPLANTEVNS